MKIHSVRLPGYVASQEVIFGSQGETLRISNEPVNRECYMPRCDAWLPQAAGYGWFDLRLG